VCPRRLSLHHATTCHSHTSPPSASTTSSLQLASCSSRVRLLTRSRRWQTVAYGLCAFRGPAGLCTVITPFRDVHCRAQRSCRQYADDCQIYIATPVSDASPVVIRLQECLCQVNAWMSSSRLQLNHKKTEVMWLGSRQQLDKLSVQQVTVVSSPVIVSSHARD